MPTKKKTTKKQTKASKQLFTPGRLAGIVVVLAVAAVGGYMYLTSNADSYSNETNGAGKSVARPDQVGCDALKRAWTNNLCQWSQTYIPAPNPFCSDQTMAYWKATPNDFCAAQPN